MKAQGRGSPTVIIEAGMGEAPVESGSWQPVIDEISKTHRIVIYDRAGLGGSDLPAKVPRTSRDIAADLKLLLTNAKIPGPYLLVAHSFGGHHARAFAAQNLQQIAGMVLVDSSHPDQDARWLATLPKPTRTEPESVRQARHFLQTRSSTISNPEQIDTQASASDARSLKSIGDKPLVVLSHSSSYRFAPGLPESLAQALETCAQDLQRDLARLSSRSRLYQSKTGGHNVHVEDPALVLRGIQEALAGF